MLIHKLLKKDSVIAIVLIFFSLYVIYYSYHLKGLAEAIDMVTPGLVPGLVGVFLLICSIVFLYQTIRQNENTAKIHKTTNFSSGFLQKIISTESIWLIGVIASIIVYRYLIVLFGFYITSFVFLVSLFIALRAVKLWRAAIISLITVGIIGYVFAVLLRVPFPHGKFIPYL